MTIATSVAQEEDAEGIAELFYKTWLATYPNEEYRVTVDDVNDRFKDRHSDAKLDKRRMELRDPGNSRIFVAKDGNRIVGLCRVERKETRNSLSAIYVLPQYQGRGLGKMLWQAAEKFLDPSKDTYVGVAVYNDQAINFYKNRGFVDTGRRFTEERLELKSGANIPQMEMILKHQ